MILSPSSTERRYRKGDRVRLVDAKTSEVGEVLAVVDMLDDEGGRFETCGVLWPIGSEPRTRGFDDRLTRWHPASDLVQVLVPVGGAA
jgi:hypothetical protein